MDAEPCPRCGTYVEELVWHGRRELCAACAERVTHPIEKEPLTAGAILSGTARLLWAVAPRAVLVTVVMQLPATALILMGGFGTGLILLYGFVQLLATGIVIDLALQYLDGERRSIAGAVSVAFRSWLGLIAASFISGLVTLVFLLLLIVPGILKALSYAIVYPLVIDGDAGGVDSLQLSKERMAGHRGQAFIAFAVAWLVPLVGMFVSGVAEALLGLEETDLLYSTAMTADQRWFEAIYNFADALLFLPVTFVSIVLHAKLRNAPRGRAT